MYTVLVVTHPHQSAEYSYSMIYVHNIVTYIERIEIVYSESLALFNTSPYAHPMETVEYLMI